MILTILRKLLTEFEEALLHTLCAVFKAFFLLFINNGINKMEYNTMLVEETIYVEK